MLEIIGIILLANKNKANAIKRGRNPGGFIALTIILWIGLELIGAVIGVAADLGTRTYLLALLFAVLGGITSYVITKNCKPGSYVTPEQIISETLAQTAEPLTSPAQIMIVREKSMVGAIVRWDFMLNGQSIGSLKNGQSMVVSSHQRQNILQAKDAYGSEIPPYIFDVAAGSMAEIYFKANKFLSARSKGVFAPSVANQQVPSAITPSTGTSPVSTSGSSQNNGPGVLLIRFSIEKLNELNGSYGFHSGKLIGMAVSPSLLEGMTISDGDSAATLRGNEYVCIVSISTPFNRVVLKEQVEPLILASDEIKACAAYPLTQLVDSTSEPLVVDGIVRDGKIEGPGGWCAIGFMDAWGKQD